MRVPGPGAGDPPYLGNGMVRKLRRKKKFSWAFLNPKNWEKDTKQVVSVILALFLLASVLALFKPPKEKMMACASPEIEAELKEDESRTRKQVTVTYNDLYFVSYVSFETQGKTVLSEKYLGFAGQIYDASAGAANFWGRMVNYVYRMLGIGQGVLYGAKLTLVLTSTTMVVGLILSVFLALGKISKHKWISKPCSAYIFFFRGTPLMIQLFAIYLAVPGLIPGFSWRGLFPEGDPNAVFKGAFMAAFIAFTLSNAAYCAEIVRAAIESIDPGQAEAAKALGLTYGQTMSKIIIPQSIRRLVPPVCNEFVMIIKDASLVFCIGLLDITTISKNIASNGDYLVFVPALVIYLVMTAFFTFVFGKVEKRLSVYL